jgi:hypothetical protein
MIEDNETIDMTEYYQQRAVFKSISIGCYLKANARLKKDSNYEGFVIKVKKCDVHSTEIYFDNGDVLRTYPGNPRYTKKILPKHIASWKDKLNEKKESI